ncbi:hypothetical protein SKAU_G00308050 [Synaphobranchus kaupii]|uniref:Uncharacterized protein n=1 Tax=Synaphobranchus kaupii TaxID=118154 RepID=A0A9Q1ER47_SYNKA|nr:hypothetical protein SKAU_G00308050 [Synaphobranchus kaupii]
MPAQPVLFTHCTPLTQHLHSLCYSHTVYSSYTTPAQISWWNVYRDKLWQAAQISRSGRRHSCNWRDRKISMGMISLNTWPWLWAQLWPVIKWLLC